MSNGIISKDRVKDFGEVFTPDNIVNDMLDLLDEQWKDLSSEEYITKTILEPACGDGQFLIRILYRKLERVKKLHKNKQLALVKAVSSIYGVDIQEDNVKRARERMLNIITGGTEHSFKTDGDKEPIHIDLGIEITDQLKKVIEFILNNNIIHGDTTAKDTLTINDYGQSVNNSNFVYLTEYTYNKEIVTMKECPITDLDLVEKEYLPIHYLSMNKRQEKQDESDF